jgi:hypothetical protein
VELSGFPLGNCDAVTTGMDKADLLSAISLLQMILTLYRFCVPYNSSLLQVVWLILFEF